jgi:hypothetical protein
MASDFKIIRGDPFSYIAKMKKNTTVAVDLAVDWDIDIKLKKGSVNGLDQSNLLTHSVSGGDLGIVIPNTSLLDNGIYVIQLKISKSSPIVILRRTFQLLITDESR